MNTIATDRLIELAEKNLPPTAEEQILLKEDSFLKAQLEQYRILFADVRSLPDPVQDEGLLAGILPSVRQEIAKRRNRSVITVFAEWHPVSRLAVALASLLLIISLAFFFFSNGSLQNSQNSAEMAFIENVTDPSAIRPTTAVWEASQIPELDLFSDLDNETINDSNEIYFDSSTFSLMNQATSLEIEEFEILKNYIKDSEL